MSKEPQSQPKLETKEETQKKFMHLKMLLQQMQQFEKQIETFDGQLTELSGVKDGLEELTTVKSGTDVFVPVSGGVFMRASIKEPEKLLVNVGANIAVAKTIPDTIKLIQDQINEIGTAKMQLAEQVQLIRHHLTGMQKELRALAQSEE